MDCLSPDGAVYQAGTLGGNPVAMSAGGAALKKINNNKRVYKKLSSLSQMLMDGFSSAAKKNNIPLQTQTRGSMFGYFFSNKKVENYECAKSVH